MPLTSLPSPLLFRPDYEVPAADEAETIEALSDTLRHVSETTFKDGGHALRSVHAKSHGLLTGELQVLDSLPTAYAQGIFGRAARYPVVMRFSTNPGDVLDDSITVPRGLALKVIGVEGERLPGSGGQVTQDFVMANAPAFAAPTPKKFLGTLSLLAKTTDTPQVLKKALSTVLRGAERVVEAVGGKSTTLISLGGHPSTNILGETFYTQVPLLFGSYFGKLSVAPVSPELTALTGAAVSTSGKPDALREAVNETILASGGTWEVRVQLCTDLDQMPVEDASVAWPEELSPYVTVARIVVPAQTGWSEARARQVDDGLAFSPWHGIAAHRPLGGIMRARRQTYEMSSGFREAHGCPLHEPRTAESLG